ncbi:MAG: hypothetical protein AMJ81_11700 [Phycisphaerae bacterium SM23_33]|nr:MAG: hypothetical protein AMJ81_11700 [Phycisphaerae bacterium SM23_33]
MLALLAAAAGAQTTQPADKTASFNFKNAPPKVVLSALEELFDVQFVTETPVTQRLSLASVGEVSADGMVALLDAALRPQGAAARREGRVIRIVPVSLAAARVEMVELKHADPAEVARIVTEIFQTRDLLTTATAQNVELIRKLVEQLKEQGGPLLAGQLRVTAVPYPRLKAIILRAPEAVLPTIKQFIVSELDKPPPPKPAPPKPPAPKPPPPIREEIYRPKFVAASYLAAAAQRLYGVSAQVEDRINAVILRTSNYSQFEQMEKLIKLLDVPDAVQEETFHLTLNNATADEVRRLLNQLYSTTLKLPFTPAGLEELTDQQRQERIAQATAVLTAAGVSEQTAAEFVRSNLGIPFGTVQIIADAANNALLLRTNPKNMPMILKVIQQLDQPRRQVMIKVFIAEVTLDDTMELGVDFAYQDTSASRTQRWAMDFNVDLEHTGLTYSFISNNITAFLRALQATSRLDIIQRPQVLTLDNRRATILFGKKVPLLQTTSITAEGSVNSTVQYTTVATELHVTPHVNAAGFIRLDIFQSIDDVSSDTFAITEQLAPRILITRQAETNVQVRDGQTVCLGGFIGDTIDETEEKVPLLSDIPVIGEAFKKTKRTRVKSELLIFITPYIVETPQELLEMTNALREETAVRGRTDRASEELKPRAVPERNPYKAWGQMGRRYVIPRPPATGPATQPATAPATGGAASRPAGQAEAATTQPAA